MDDYARCRFSITCHTADLAVVHCLRALCQHNVAGVRPQIAWGGTSEKNWNDQENCITLRFTSSAQRDGFVRDANRLLAGHWTERSRSDNDPATRQREPH